MPTSMPLEQLPTDRTLLLQQILNHVNTMNDEMGDLLERVSRLEAQVESLLWINRLVMGIIITAVVGALLTLIIRTKGSKKNNA